MQYLPFPLVLSPVDVGRARTQPSDQWKDDTTNLFELEPISVQLHEVWLMYVPIISRP